MTFAHEVNLPRDQKPIWPNHCVCCFAEDPAHKTLSWTFSIGWHAILFWTPGTIHSTRVPICHQCRGKFHAKRAGKVVLSMLLCVIAVYFAFEVLGSYGGMFRKPLAMLISIGGMLPWFFWETFFPPAFDMFCYRKSVDYVFRDPRFAAAFRQLK